MIWFKRIFLFAALNLLVIFTISLLLNFFGVGPYLTARGIDYSNLLAFCLIWGMGGAFISLALSRLMAKWMMRVQVVDSMTRDPRLQALLQTVHRLARSAHLPRMPEVGVYPSQEVNAFATGPTRAHALVAVSEGLLSRMSDDEIEGVLGHEVAHIANGDMVTMTLLQGVVNAFAMFLSRVIAFALAQAMRGDREESRDRSPYMTWMIKVALEMVFMMLGALVVAWFSRYREYRADAGGARLAGRFNMIRALEALRRQFNTMDTQEQGSTAAIQTLKISNRSKGWISLFASHPPLEDRIARLQESLS